MALINNATKEMFLDSLLATNNRLRDALDAGNKTMTIADLPERAREEMANNVDTSIVLAHMLEDKVTEIEAANPSLVEELRVATEDYRVLNGMEHHRRDQWRLNRRNITRAKAGLPPEPPR